MDTDKRMKKAEEQKEIVLPCFTKEKLLTLKRYYNRRDLLTALLEDGHSYTLPEVDNMISEFMKGKVK